MGMPNRHGVDLPISEAAKDLTGFEVIGIEEHYGRPFENIGATRLLLGCVWAFSNR